ncbi:c-type cytochrome [Falsiroseomonas sp.]|uniref:SorU family sulfite dehydrogenase c-type cytochrome subunit n=1 Tax=Falsiroseomonas sp. TaxID=2870721 RepID=UPI0035683B43
MLLLVVMVAAAARGDDAPDGRRIFTAGAAPPCGVCHTLAAAGTEGEIGPNLDQLKPDSGRVRRAVTSGPGSMPAYDSLNEAEIEAVARYVAEVAGKG